VGKGWAYHRLWRHQYSFRESGESASSIHPFADPIYQGVQADLFYCGPAGPEQAIVEQLIAEIGLRPIYLGESAMVEVVDGVIRLWAALAFFQDMGVNNVAFKVLTR
jgi:predicted dinucleotide-binding enzyme